MRGIILAGGQATRLRPLTKITSKQLLPVYDKPMIFYPLTTLLQAGIKEVLIIIAPEYAGQFMNLLGSGKDFGEEVKFTYEIQDHPRGLADAFIIGENFIDDEPVAMVLGDNIFMENLSEHITSFERGARIFATKVTDPERFGVVQFDEDFTAQSIEEKPKNPKSPYAVTGMYLYDAHVVEIAKNLKPSARGEIEITDINNVYLKKGELDVRLLTKPWFDAGTFDSLLDASQYVSTHSTT